MFNYASFLSKISPRKLPFQQIHVSIFIFYLPCLIWEWADNNSHHHLLYATISDILSFLSLSSGIYVDGHASPVGSTSCLIICLLLRFRDTKEVIYKDTVNFHFMRPRSKSFVKTSQPLQNPGHKFQSIK